MVKVEIFHYDVVISNYLPRMTEINNPVDQNQTPVVDIPAVTEVPTQDAITIPPDSAPAVPAAPPTAFDIVASDEVPEPGAPEPQTVQPEEGTQSFPAEPARDLTAHRDQEPGEVSA